ncbi:urease accessory protein UreD [Hymenobacter sp. BT770]|uniref:urease accessory protein UreD n=1 Tax=Hymenobacter sp. BT770 TaxID=2886942 RepID=UPI001D10CEC9|nr:urease accessory protein UreD [Hymenobacter sp. BT770]MCC3152594.1 urease accessory protein UreD [Hymenobacter sp. BT770]MDO3414667.1 urease accessory protein UreD [Hymenobacter sp. BT770]
MRIDAPVLARPGTSMEWSTLEVARVRNQSRLITCKSLQPLKVFNPNSPTAACHVVLSSYGGGMVAGDAIRLRISGQAHTQLVVSTQASTKIFRSIDGAVAEQHTTGRLAEGALAVVFPDPVVLQAESRYRQLQEWHLQPDSLLLVVDWFHSGRMDQGERFAFTSLHSELRVRVAGQLVLLDRFAFSPTEHIATSPGNFADYQTFFSVFLVGSPTDARFRLLAARLELQKMPGSTGPHFTITSQECLVSVARARENVYVLRAAARSRAALQPLCDQLLEALADDALLGYNPLQRKY